MSFPEGLQPEPTEKKSPLQQENITQLEIGDDFIDFNDHVHYSNYADVFEVGRSDFLSARGLDYEEIESEYGLRRFVKRMDVTYHAPMFNGDKVEIATGVERVGNSSVSYSQSIRKDDEPVAEGNITIVFVNKNGKAASIPVDIKEKLSPPEAHR
jgi:acyl-CoA thioester hydrolase